MFEACCCGAFERRVAFGYLLRSSRVSSYSPLPHSPSTSFINSVHTFVFTSCRHLYTNILKNASSSDSLVFEQLPFSHPLFILYSSGTTGVPKCIVHSAGGTLIQHLKEHKIHGQSLSLCFFYLFCLILLFYMCIKYSRHDPVRCVSILYTHVLDDVPMAHILAGPGSHIGAL